MRASATRQVGELDLRVDGQDAQSNAGISDCIRSGMTLVTPDPKKLPLKVVVHNDIPVGIGLGSSAAGVICGIVLAAAAKNLKLTANRIADMAAQVEGHADNAAAAVFGGICFVQTNDELITSVLHAPRRLQFAIVVPSISLKTSYTRSMLPNAYNRTDVVHNMQRTARLAVGLVRGDVRSVIAALDDRLHEPYRASLVPAVAKALAERTNTIGVILSGSGPGVLVLTVKRLRASAGRVAAHFRDAGIQARVILLRVDNAGLVVKGALRTVAAS
jgi:homoserine kinase